MSLVIEARVTGPFQENSYFVGDEASAKAWVVDPGGDIPHLAMRLSELKLEVVAVILTHGHIDHVAGAAEACSRFAAPLWMHQADVQWLEALSTQAAMFGLDEPPTPTVTCTLADREELVLGTQRAQVIHTPGHTEGGLCLFFPDAGVLLTGDTLFKRSIGRTDLPGGNLDALLRSIRERLFPLGDAVEFYPGHGPGGNLGDERRLNPFVSSRVR